MKKLIFLILLIFIVPAIAFATGTISGTHKEDGTPTAGYQVDVYSFGTVGDYDISNAAYVFGSTTQSDGTWTGATTLTTPHLIIIKDNANDVKKSIQIWETPTPD